MICLAVTYIARDGSGDQVAELARLTIPSRAEPGCRMYLTHRSTSDPNRFFLYEQYVDQAALDAHRAAPHFEEIGKGKLFPLLESRTPEYYVPLTD